MVLRRLGGILLLLLGVAGVIACGVALYHTGSVKRQLRHFVGEVSLATEEAFAGVLHRLDQIDASLAHVREDLKAVVSSADALEEKGNGEETPTEHIAFTLDHKVQEKLSNAQQLVDSAEDTAEAVSRLLALLQGEDPDSDKNSEREGPLVTKIKGASGTLSQLPAMLERARETARNLKQHPGSKEALRALTREVGQMDKGLEDVQALGLEFRKTIQGFMGNYRYYRAETFRYIRMGGMLIPLLLVWLGAGQLALVILGGRLMMRRSV
jgi:hypothetical protein